MDQPGGAVAAQRGPEAPDLALAEAEHLGCLTRRDHVTGELGEYLNPALL